MSGIPTDLSSVYEMTTEEFNEALNGLDFLWDPLPFVDMPENFVESAGQLREVPPSVTNELTETGNLNSLSTTSPAFNPPEGQMEYPSPDQAFKPIDPYFAAAQDDLIDHVINDGFISDDEFSDDLLFTDESAPSRHVPRKSAAGFVNNLQDDMNRSNRYSNQQHPNQAQRSGIPAPHNNLATQKHGSAQPGTYRQAGAKTYSSTPHTSQPQENHGYAMPNPRHGPSRPTLAPNGCKPSSSGPRTAPMNHSKSKEQRDVILISSDLEDPEGLSLSPAELPTSKNLGRAIPPVRSQIAPQAEMRRPSQADTRPAPDSVAFVGYDPASHYQKLPRTPGHWDIFQYNKYGELMPGRLYSASELRRYLFEHHLHRTSSGYNPAKGGLTLWIQQNPFDSLHRCGNPEAARCRFLKCSGNKNTIKPGEIRVAFDEHTKNRHNHDPQHNAGYVHLFCLERFMDFPDICLKLDIRAEDRSLPLEPHGNNLMHLETVQEFKQARKFIESCRRGRLDPAYPHYQTIERGYEGTLMHEMAMGKAAAAWAPQQKQVEGKVHPGVDISKNSGNLERDTQTRMRFQQIKQKKRSLPMVTEENSEEDEEKIEDRKNHAQLRRWAFRVVCEHKKKSTWEKNENAMADVEWAKKYLKSNPIQKRKPQERLLYKPLSRPVGRPRKNVNPPSRPTKSQAIGSQGTGKAITHKRSASTMSSVEESDEGPQPKRRYLTKRPVDESEGNEGSEEEPRPRRSKRGRSPDEDSEESEEEPQPRRSKRARRRPSKLADEVSPGESR